MDFRYCKGCGALFTRELGDNQIYCPGCKGTVIEEKHYQDAERYKFTEDKE